MSSALLTEYEREREALIARNRARMAELGITGLARKAGLFPQQPAKKRPAPSAKKSPSSPSPSSPHKKRHREEESEMSAPTRRSTRRSTRRGGGDKDAQDEEVAAPSLDELEAIERGRSRATPRSPRAPSGRSMEERVHELEELNPAISQLVDWTDATTAGATGEDDDDKDVPASAEFVVIGSKGNHYRVVLGGDRHKCGCMDWRLRGRQRHCKHICLLLNQLGGAFPMTPTFLFIYFFPPQPGRRTLPSPFEAYNFRLLNTRPKH